MDLREFQNTVYPLKNKLFRFARRLLDHTEEAEDVVQEAFIRLWNKREALDEYRSVEALAMITVKNLCLDRIKTKKYPVEHLDNHRAFIESMPAHTGPDHSDLVNGIRMAMELLPGQQKMIVHLRDIEGYEFSEIAGIAGMTENAIRVTLSRARKRIREMIVNKGIYEYHGN